MFKCNISSSGELPADYDSMVGTRYAFDDDLEYLLNSAISFSQLYQSDNQQEQREETDSTELDMDEDWLRNLLSSEDIFDPDFLENLDLESLETNNVQEEGETDLAEDVSLSVGQVSEVQEDSQIMPENCSLVELLTDGPGVGLSREAGLGSQLEEVEMGTSSAEVDSFDPDFLENIDLDSLEHSLLGYTVEMEMMEEPEHHLPPTPPQSPEERSAARVTGAVVSQPQSRPALNSTVAGWQVMEVIVERDSPPQVTGIVKDQAKKKKCRMLEEDKAAHNRLERERRRELNSSYGSLRDIIPAIASKKKSSKQIILDSALDYCRGLAGKLERLERIEEKEVQRRRELEELLSRLQSGN